MKLLEELELSPRSNKDLTDHRKYFGTGLSHMPCVSFVRRFGMDYLWVEDRSEERMVVQHMEMHYPGMVCWLQSL